MWTVKERPSPVGLPNSYVRYGIQDGKVLSSDKTNQQDYRYLSGRTLLLPQPVFSLASTAQSVIDSLGFQESLSAEDEALLINSIKKLKFISTPLSGITEHLLTRVMGTHVKPTITYPGKTPIVLPAAITAATDIKMNEDEMNEDVMKLIDTKR